jgi:PEP-CTERM motif
MYLTKHSRFRLALRASAATLLVLSTLVMLGHSSQGAAFSDFAFGLGGNPLTAPYPNADSNFFRWEQSPITYAFDPTFTVAYGAAGQSEVDKAFATWAAGMTADDTAPLDESAPFSGTDVSILGVPAIFDLQSVALHEIGHAIGFDHPNPASGNGANNYNVVAGDWVNGALPGDRHPIMWDTIAANISRQELTLDDIQAAQFLYSDNTAGVGTGDAGGPVFGNNAVPLSFSDITGLAGSPDILFKGGTFDDLILASTINTLGFANVPGFSYTKAIDVTAMVITIRVPEPASGVLWIMAAGGFAVVVFRRRLRRAWPA